MYWSRLISSVRPFLSPVWWAPRKVQKIAVRDAAGTSPLSWSVERDEKYIPPFVRLGQKVSLRPASCPPSVAHSGGQHKGQQSCSFYCPQWLSSASLQKLSPALDSHMSRPFQEWDSVFSLTEVALPQPESNRQRKEVEQRCSALHCGVTLITRKK